MTGERTKMKPDKTDDIFNLTEDDMKIMDTVVRPQKMSVRDALRTTEPLYHISNNISMETKEQQLFHRLYAAILEVNSAGTPVIFDRYDQSETEFMYQAYKTLGAEKFCFQIETMRAFIREHLGDSYSEDDMFALCDTDEYNKIDRQLTLQYEEVRDEMEDKLLEFVKHNIERLENR